MLGMKKRGAQLAEKGSMTDWYPPVEETSPERKSTFAKTPTKGGTDRLLEALKSHAIDILAREDPSKKGYYKMVWRNQSLEDLINYQLPNIYEDIPEGGFADD